MPARLSPRQILDRLVSFPTVSRDTNLPLIDWVEDYLESQGVTAHRVWNEDRTKASLYAHIGPEVAGGVVLSGHTDVVPVDGQVWSSDPWTVTERDGRLYGRGTCDMKGFVALALAAVPLALAADLKRPLQLALSYDEELGCTGAPPMIAEMARRLPRAAAGYEVHSSLIHTGVSAIMAAAPLIDFANRVNAANAARPPAALAQMFDPPWTTLHVGMIRGGTAHNITAADCRLSCEIRVVPGEDIEDWVAAFEGQVAQAVAAMQTIRPETGITVERFFSVPPLRPETDGAAEALARRLTGDNGLHVVSYGTEAGQFQAEGYSAVVCGPGDILQAHQPDEFLEISEFDAGWSFMQRLVAWLS